MQPVALFGALRDFVRSKRETYLTTAQRRSRQIMARVTIMARTVENAP